MKKNKVTICMLILIMIIFTACGANEDKPNPMLDSTSEQQSTEPKESNDTSNPVVDSESEQQSTEPVESNDTDFEGKYITSEDGSFDIKLYDSFKLYYEESFKHLLVYEYDEQYFARIETLGKDIDVDGFRDSIIENYKAMGEVVELNTSDHPTKLIRESDFAVKIKQDISNESITSITIAIVKMEGTYFKISIFIPEGQSSEIMEKQMMEMMLTITPN